MRRRSIVVLACLLSVIAAVVFLRFRYAGKAPVHLDAAQCDADLWNHVYERDRLQVIEACTAVEGKVVSVHRAQDGDMHVSLNPDRKAVLNLINVMHAKGTLAVEAVCDHEASDGDAKRSCGDFVSRIPPPAVGDRIRVTGAYVIDRDNGWTEIHPVSRIEKLP